MATFLFIMSGVGFLMVILCGIFAPHVLGGAIAKAGAPAVMCLLAGMAVRRKTAIRQRPEFDAAKRRVDELFYIRADIEECLRLLPPDYRVKSRNTTFGFLRGAFRSFERIVIEGPLLIVTIDCIGHDVVARRTDVRDPAKG